MSFNDNTTKDAQATDVGLKISKPGYDANQAAGNNLLFSSSWPSLPVAFSTTITNPLTGGGTSGTVAHNLKYAPLSFVWAYGTDPSGKTACIRRINVVASMDTVNVYLGTSGTTEIDTDFLFSATKLHIKCFQLDLSQDIDYILAAGDTFPSSYDPNFGIKLARPNKDINSRDLRDFALHSRAQSPLVLAIKTQATNNSANPLTTQYSSHLNFPSWVYGYVRKSTGRYSFAPYGAQAYPITFTDGKVSNLTTIAPDTGATVVVLRDPMFSSSLVTAQF